MRRYRLNDNQLQFSDYSVATVQIERRKENSVENQQAQNSMFQEFNIGVTAYEELNFRQPLRVTTAYNKMQN